MNDDEIGIDVIEASIDCEKAARWLFVIARSPNDGAIGACRLSLSNEIAFIGDLFVRPEFRGRGIGTAIIRKCEEHARSDGKRAVSLTVYKANTSAVRLYERLGYAALYDDNKQWWMSRPLERAE